MKTHDRSVLQQCERINLCDLYRQVSFSPRYNLAKVSTLILARPPPQKKKKKKRKWKEGRKEERREGDKKGNLFKWYMDKNEKIKMALKVQLPNHSTQSSG